MRTKMRFSKIIFCSDILRGVHGFPEAFFDFIREPIRQGCGVDTGSSCIVDFYKLDCLGFDLNKFRELAGFEVDDDFQKQWRDSYFKMENSALDYFFSYFTVDHLIVGFEMPPWFSEACIEREIFFINMGGSPLRFSRDLYISLRSSCSEISERIRRFIVLDEELRLEASTLRASVWMHQRRLESERNYKFECLEDTVIFIGQAPYDASLIAPDKRSLRCTDFSSELQKICKNKRVLHKPHPLALEFAETERQQLERIIGCQVLFCKLSAYQILSSHDKVQLVGISSSMLQEAAWFDKTAHTLYQPYVPLSSSNKYTSGAYQQIHFQTFLSPEFWHQILAPEQPAPRLLKLTPLVHHHAREAFDHWWDYSKVLTWERVLPYEAFMRSGGAQFRDRITSLERKIEAQSFPSEQEKIGEVDEDELRSKLLISLYTRLANNYQNIDEALSKNISPVLHKEKNLDASYYQDLHDNSVLFKSNNWLLPYLEVIRSKKYYSVRDIGCGNGAFSAEIAKSVGRVVGLDWAKSPLFPESHNIQFEKKDITKAKLDFFDLNCSADVLEHIETSKLSAVIESLHNSSRFNFHVIACYDDGHSHLSILPPDAWLFLFNRLDSKYRIFDISIRHSDISHIVCVVTNI